MRCSIAVLISLALYPFGIHASEQRVAAPGGALTAIVTDDHGLHLRVEIDGKPVVNDSPLGLEFKDGVKLGPAAAITKTQRTSHDSKWENRFGNNRFVRDHYRELHLTLEERAADKRTFGLF